MIRRALPSVRLLAAVTAALIAAACGPSESPPEQPIAFRHAPHAAKGIDCLQCHLGADKVDRAGLPPIDTCASCHFGQIPDHPEVQKVFQHYDDKEPIRWVKVNVMPESAMVHFPHAVHVRAGVECSACHGDVASMGVAEPVIELADMGFCLDCHRQRQATTDCVACHH